MTARETIILVSAEGPSVALRIRVEGEGTLDMPMPPEAARALARALLERADQADAWQPSEAN